MQHVSSGIFSVPRMSFVPSGRDGYLNHPIHVRNTLPMYPSYPTQFDRNHHLGFQPRNLQNMFSYAPQSHTPQNFIRRQPVSQPRHSNSSHPPNGTFSNQNRVMPGPPLCYVRAYFNQNSDNSTRRPENCIYPHVIRIRASAPVLDQPLGLDVNITDLKYCIPPNCIPAEFIPFTEMEKEFYFKDKYNGKMTLRSVQPELYPDLRGDFVLVESEKFFIATSHGVKYKLDGNLKPRPICIPYNIGILPIFGPRGAQYDASDERASDSDNGSMIDEGISSPTTNVSHTDWNSINAEYEGSDRADGASYYSGLSPSVYVSPTRRPGSNNIGISVADEPRDEWEIRAANYERRRAYGFYSPGNFDMPMPDDFTHYSSSDATARNRGPIISSRNNRARSNFGLHNVQNNGNDGRNFFGTNSPGGSRADVDSEGRNEMYPNTYTYYIPYNQNHNIIRCHKYYDYRFNNGTRTGNTPNIPTFSMRDYNGLPTQTLRQRTSQPAIFRADFRPARETRQEQATHHEPIHPQDSREVFLEEEPDIGSPSYEEPFPLVEPITDATGNNINNANSLNPLSAPFIFMQNRGANSVDVEPRVNDDNERDDRSVSTDEALVLDDTDDYDDEEENKSFVELNNQLRNAIADVPKSYTLQKPLPYSSGDSCPICFDVFEESKVISITRCGHLFCSQCISRALEISQRCPFCTVYLSIELDVFPIKYDNGNYVINTLNLTY